MDTTQNKNGLLWNTYIPNAAKGAWNWLSSGWKSPSQAMSDANAQFESAAPAPKAATASPSINPLSVPTANAQTNPSSAIPQASAPGSPQAAATQQQNDMQNLFPGLSDHPPVTSMSPAPFSINPGDSISSSSANSMTTTNDALARANDLRTQLYNGSAPSNYVPSDGLYGSVINGIFNASQYTPQEQNALSQYNDTQSRIISTQLAARRQLQQLHENGQITKDQAAGFLTEAQRRSDAQLADLAAQQSGNTLSLQTLGMLRQNQLGAYQNISGFLKPTEVAPGSTLVNPITGQSTYQGNGAAPSTIMQTAQQLAQMAIQSGTMQYNTDGTPNLQPYLEQAQSYYQTHQVLGGSGGGMNSPQNNQQLPGGQSGASGSSQGNVAQNTYQYGLSAGLPPTLAGAVQQSPVTGDYYINGAKTGGIPDQAVTSQSGRSGIGYVPSANVGNIQQLDIAIGQMQNVWGMAQKYLSPGLLGRLKGLTTNQANTMLQTDPGWAQFNAVRLQAIDYLKGLAQGGGFRTTQSEIDTAANSILSISDNLESAKAKMDMAMKNINLAYREYLPTHNETPLVGPSQQHQTGSNVIQTKVGAVDNSWFK